MNKGDKVLIKKNNEIGYIVKKHFKAYFVIVFGHRYPVLYKAEELEKL